LIVVFERDLITTCSLFGESLSGAFWGIFKSKIFWEIQELLTEAFFLSSAKQNDQTAEPPGWLDMAPKWRRTNEAF
jgi:hypothetical protein